jgi:hypothetical protein
LTSFIGRYLSKQYARRGRAPLTVVNISAWYSLVVLRQLEVNSDDTSDDTDSDDMDSDDSVRYITTTHFTETLRNGEERPVTSDANFLQLIRPHLDESIPDIDRDELIKAVTFLSLDEYRQKVGEQRLRLETELVYA